MTGTRKRPTNPFGRLPLLFALVILLSAGSATLLAFRQSRNQLEDSLARELLAIVRSAAPAINGDLHNLVFRDSDGEIQNFEEFLLIQEHLIAVKEANGLYGHGSPIYTLRKAAGFSETKQLEFVVMTDRNPEGEFFTGYLYPAQPHQLRALAGQASATPVYQDEEGIWISAASPIRDQSGKVVGIIQADRHVEFFHTQVQRQALTLLLSAIISVCLVGLVSIFFARRLTRMGKALADSEQRVRSILETANDAFIAVDARGGVVTWNRSAAQIFGWSESEALGRNLSELILGEQYRESPELGLRYVLDLSEGGGREEILLYDRDKKEIPAELTVSRMETRGSGSASGEPDVIYSIFLHDITERKREAEKREILERQLRQSRKIEAIGLLAGGIAHDFNNLLVPVLGLSELSMLETKPGSLLHDNLQEIHTAAIRGRNLVEQILTFSRRSEKVVQAVALKPLIQESLSLLRATLPSTIAIDSDLPADSADMLGDAGQMQQMILNLCTNAAHSMEGRNGVLKVALRHVFFSEQIHTSHAVLPPGDYLRLTISDTGCGMSEEVMEKIFDPFFTTRTVDKGTGLGLATVLGIVQEHAGGIVVRSKEGEGSTFEIFLPRRELTLGEEPTEATAITGGSEHVLLVDDEEAVRNTVSQMLQHLGYRVTGCADGASALDAFSSEPGSFDAVVTDLTMPGLTGSSLEQALRKIRPEIGVLLITGHAEQDSSVELPAAPRRRILTKPLTLGKLSTALREVIEKKVAVTLVEDSP